MVLLSGERKGRCARRHGGLTPEAIADATLKVPCALKECFGPICPYGHGEREYVDDSGDMTAEEAAYRRSSAAGDAAGHGGHPPPPPPAE